MPNILGGLMAGANFGTGFVQGQQQAKEREASNALNDLAIQDYKLKVDQDKLAASQQQLLSDRAMQLFNPMAPPGGQPVQQANMPGTNQPMDISQPTGSDQQKAPEDKIEQLANFAAGSGDLVRANQLWTNAANLRNTRFEAQQHKAAAETAELKRQQMHYNLASQYAGIVPDSPEGFAQWKMAMLSDPNASDEERANISKMPYHPGLMQKIQDSGMTASQKATARLKEQEFAEKQRVNDLNEAHKQRKDAEDAAHHRAMEQKGAVDNKVGAAAKAPTENEILAATQATREAMGGDQVDTKDPAFIRARANVAARANQIVRDNRAVTYPQAVTMAAEEAKKNGEFQPVDTADTHARIFGMKIPFTGEDASSKPGYKEKGMTKDTAIPFTGQAKSDLVPGRFYQTGNGLMQWTGTGWKPQQ